MKPKVFVYSTPTCTYCRVVKEFLRARGVPYMERDAEKPGVIEDLSARAGQSIRSVPVIEIGEDFLVGYDPLTLDQILQKNGY